MVVQFVTLLDFGHGWFVAHAGDAALRSMFIGVDLPTLGIPM